VFDDNDVVPESLEKAKQAYELVVEGDTTDEAHASEAAELIHEIAYSVKERLSESKTACLWFWYFELYLQSLFEMLRYFAASDHNLSAKST